MREKEQKDKKVLKDNKSRKTPIFQRKNFIMAQKIFISYMAGEKMDKNERKISKSHYIHN